MHWCILSTAAIDVLVLKHQAISNHSADQSYIEFNQFHKKNIISKVNNTRKIKSNFEKKCLMVTESVPHIAYVTDVFS